VNLGVGAEESDPFVIFFLFAASDGVNFGLTVTLGKHDHGFFAYFDIKQSDQQPDLSSAEPVPVCCNVWLHNCAARCLFADLL
jgi:hypothetical protein